MTSSSGGLVLYKRWILRAGVSADVVRDFVEREIVPRYASLSVDVELGLEVSPDGRSVLAIQRWRSSEAHRRATTGAEYERWWREYEPRLAVWSNLVTLADEWTTAPMSLHRA